MKELRTLLGHIELANRRWRLFQRNDSILIALSGGPDSVALLVLLTKLRHKYQLKLFAAHLDHGLFPVKSRQYLRLCQKTCDRLDIPLYSKSIKLRSLARRSGRGLEEEGRLQRYAFFEVLAEQLKIKKVATAHTLDDQAETVLMRIIRGCGIRGLVGIPVKRKLGKRELIRPLLFSSKQALLAWLKKDRISYCNDPMNISQDFTRNIVRHQILQLITQKINPRATYSLSNLQGVAVQVSEYLEEKGNRAFASCLVKRSPSHLLLHAEQFRKMHPALQSEVLLKAVLLIKGDTLRVAQIHIQEVMDLMNSKKGGRYLLLPGGIRVEKHPKFLQISMKRDTIRPL